MKPAPVHDPAGQTIRAQAKKDKAAKASAQAAGGDKATANRTVTKATLASPLTVPWPNIPRHLQTTVVNALPQLVPSEVADYHVSRQRCQRLEKKLDRKASRAAKKDADLSRPNSGEQEDDKMADEATTVEDDTKAGGPSTGKPARPPRPQAAPAPIAPEILVHLVLGTNEIIKALERQTDNLRLRIMVLGDALNAQMKPKAGASATKGKRKRAAEDAENKGDASDMDGDSEMVKRMKEQRYLPTAPPPEDIELDEAASPEPNNPSTATDTGDKAAPGDPAAPAEEPHKPTIGLSNPTRRSAKSSPLRYILIPLPDINPPSLVAPIPAYCATYNTLVYQYDHLSKIARTRLPQEVMADFGGDGPNSMVEEVQVVPLGRVEAEMAAMAGLRRIACLGIRIKVLQTLLPKSVLHPPRHSLTLPFPIPKLSVHSGTTDSDQPADKRAANNNGDERKTDNGASTSAPLLPLIHYAPLHVKGITTTVPADGASRKAKRLEEVRQKRRDNKAARKVARQEMEADIMKGLKRKALGLRGPILKRVKRSANKTKSGIPGEGEKSK